MSESTRLGMVKIVMLKGEKGDQGAGVYDDTEVKSLITAEARERASEVNSLQITKADKTELAVESARMDTVISQTRSEVVTLWTGSMSSSGGTYTLSESVANFDFIDIYCENLSTHFVRIPANKTSLNLYIPWFDTAAVLEVGKLSLTISGTQVTLAQPREYFWNGTFEEHPSLLNAQVSVPVRIDGVRYARLESSEVADIRVGADGITYPNAGDAVRGQISDLKADLSQSTKNLLNPKLFPSVWSESNGVYTFTRSQFMQLNIPFEGKENTQYTFSCLCDVAGIVLIFNYSDGTTSNVSLYGQYTGEFVQYSGVSSANKTLTKLTATYGTAGATVVRMRDIQLEEGVYPTNYVPYITGDDVIALNKANDIKEKISKYYDYSLVFGSIAMTASAWSYDTPTTLRDARLSEPIFLNAGDIIRLTNSDYQIKVGWIYNNGTRGYTNWETGGVGTILTAKTTGLYQVDIKKPDNSAISMSEIYSAFKIEKNSAEAYAEYLPNKQFKSYAHRGYQLVSPENTIPSFIMAKKYKFDGIETDVRKTSDGKYVIIHDSSVARTSNGSGNVESMTLDQLKALDFGSWFSPNFANTKIPTFAEMLDCCKKLDLTPLIEFKIESNWTTDDIDNLVSIVKDYGMFEKVVWHNTPSEMLSYLAETYQGSRIAPLCKVTSANIEYYNSIHGTDGIYTYSTQIDATDIANAKEAGIPLGFSVVNTYANYSTLDPYITMALSDYGNVSAMRLAEVMESI